MPPHEMPRGRVPPPEGTDPRRQAFPKARSSDREDATLAIHQVVKDLFRRRRAAPGNRAHPNPVATPLTSPHGKPPHAPEHVRARLGPRLPPVATSDNGNIPITPAAVKGSTGKYLEAVPKRGLVRGFSENRRLPGRFCATFLHNRAAVHGIRRRITRIHGDRGAEPLSGSPSPPATWPRVVQTDVLVRPLLRPGADNAVDWPYLSSPRTSRRGVVRWRFHSGSCRVRGRGRTMAERAGTRN